MEQDTIKPAQEMKDLNEKKAFLRDVLAGNALFVVLGDRWLNPAERAKGGIFDRAERQFSVDPNEGVFDEGRLNMEEVLAIGQEIAGQMDQENHGDFVKLLVASKILRKIVIDEGGRTVGVGGQIRDIQPVYYNPQNQTYSETNVSVASMLEQEMERYDLSSIVEEIKTGHDTSDLRSRLGVACLMLALSTPRADFKTVDAETIRDGWTIPTSAEIHHYSDLSSQDRAQRKKTEKDIVAKFCNGRFGFQETHGLFVKKQDTVLKMAAIAEAEDHTTFGLTDQGEIWRKNTSEEWEPFVVKREDFMQREVLGVALTSDLERTEGRKTVDEAIRAIAKIDEDGVMHTDLRSARIAKAVPQRTDTIQFGESELATIYENQQKERKEMVIETVIDLQINSGVIALLEESDRTEIEIVRANGKSEKVKPVGKSVSYFSGSGNDIPEMAEIGNHPQFYIGEDGQVYTKLMVQTDDDRYVAVELNKKKDRLIESDLSKSPYYDTGLNIAFLDMSTDDPREFSWTFKEAPCKKGNESFPWFQFFVDQGEYYPPSTKMIAVEVDGAIKAGSDRLKPEGFSLLSFEEIPTGEIKLAGERVAGPGKPLARRVFNYALRTEGQENKIIETTEMFGRFGKDLDPAGRIRKVSQQKTRLQGMSRDYPNTTWHFLAGGKEDTFEVSAPEGFIFSHDKNTTKATMIARVDNPQEQGFIFFIDIDGNIYKQETSASAINRQPRIIYEPSKRLKK